MSTSCFRTILAVAFVLILAISDVRADCPPEGCPKQPAQAPKVTAPAKKPAVARQPAQKSSPPKSQTNQERDDGQSGLPVPPGSTLDLLQDPAARRFFEDIQSPEFKEQTAQLYADDLARQIAALRAYETELLKERNWHDARRAYSTVVMTGKRVTGPAPAYLDKNGRPLPDDKVIGPDMFDAAATYQDSKAAIKQLDSALSDVRRQIKELEAKQKALTAKAHTPPASAPTYLSPTVPATPSDTQLRAVPGGSGGAQGLGPDQF